MNVQDVSFTSNGVRCAADLYFPEDLGSEPRAGLVIGHGFNMTKKALVQEGRSFAEAGYVVMAIDYRTFGESDGTPRGKLFPLREVEDFRYAISYLRGREEVDPDRVGIWGVSFGGGIVLHTAACDSRVRAVVAQSPAVNGRRWMRELRNGDEWVQLLEAIEEDYENRLRGEDPRRVPFAEPGNPIAGIPSGTPDLVDEDAAPDPENPNPVRFPMELQQPFEPTILLQSLEKVIDFRPDTVIDMIAPRPLKIVANGGYDQVHFTDHIQDAFRRAGEPKELVFLPYGVTGLYEEPGRGEAIEEAVDFFHEHLPPRG